MYNKDLKAYFKLVKYILSFQSSVNYDTSIHVFDHTVRPILLYGSEIWGSLHPSSPRHRVENMPSYTLSYNALKCSKNVDKKMIGTVQDKNIALESWTHTVN